MFVCSVSSQLLLFSLSVEGFLVHTLWLKFVPCSSHRHRHVSCARWVTDSLSDLSLSFFSFPLSSCTSFCFSPSSSLMSWTTTTRTAAEEFCPPDVKNSSTESTSWSTFDQQVDSSPKSWSTVNQLVVFQRINLLTNSCSTLAWRGCKQPGPPPFWAPAPLLLRLLRQTPSPRPPWTLPPPDPRPPDWAMCWIPGSEKLINCWSTCWLLENQLVDQ